MVKNISSMPEGRVLLITELVSYILSLQLSIIVRLPVMIYLRLRGLWV